MAVDAIVRVSFQSSVPANQAANSALVGGKGAIPLFRRGGSRRGQPKRRGWDKPFAPLDGREKQK